MKMHLFSAVTYSYFGFKYISYEADDSISYR